MKKKFVKIVFVVAIALVSGVNVFNAQKTGPLFDLTMSHVESLAQSESMAGGVKCLGKNDIECAGELLSGVCNVQSTNNAAIVSCDQVYVQLGDCCGIKTVTIW